VLLGPTGAGKTLLLETIMGFNTPDEGRILIDNQEITDVAPEKRGIGYVPQNSVLFPHMTVHQNIAFGLKMRDKPKHEQDKTVNELLDLVGIKNLANRLPAGLSGGEKQKVALARVLALDSKIVLLDEPLAAMDSETARQLRKELKRIHKEHRKTVVHVTHSLIEAFGLADKLAIINAGEIVQVGKAKELASNPKNEFAARILGYENVFRVAVIERGKDFSILQVNDIKLRVLGSVEHVKLVAVRPEDITVESSPIRDANANVLKASIVDCSDLGPLVMIEVDAGLPLRVVMAKSYFLEKGFESGNDVWVKFKADAVKIIE
jgi:molybdate/tungstate transport system ATP-binding protein